MKNHKSLSSIAHILENPNLFHLNRHSVSRGAAIGLASAMLPVWGHMLIAAFLAVWCRANITISVLLVWISNPLTFAFILISEYKIGALLLGIEKTVSRQDFRLSEWKGLLSDIWQPLLLGSIALAALSALTGYLIVIGLWRWEVIRKWKKRAALRS